jgi:hypothetical protein
MAGTHTVWDNDANDPAAAPVHDGEWRTRAQMEMRENATQENPERAGELF